MRCLRAHKIGGKREKVLKSKGKRVFKARQDVVHEVKSRVRKFIEEKAFHGRAKKPWKVEESEREIGGGY